MIQDITPSGLRDFFHPFALLHAHVLLDPKGKTLSHAFVEVPRGNVRDALRSVQNKTMGKGKRLRGVTVTMSNQGELMRAVCRPSFVLPAIITPSTVVPLLDWWL